ncbi:MAG: sulfatase-like hydrolase/transferase, partial [candidate division Zixibacteria bacterium]|nr:sulfatase-like hydrolase/transferase [candidate division Zixibacteria bacterium]
MKARFRYVSNIAIYYLTVAMTLSFFFEIWRLLTLLQLRDRAASAPSSVIAQSFLAGLRFDFSIACYITLPLLLFGMLPFVDISRLRAARWVNNALLFSISAVAFYINLADIEFFRFFNTRLNGMALDWIDTPGFVATMIWETYPVIRYSLLFAVIYIVFVIVILRIQRILLRNRQPSSIWLNLAYLPLLTAIVVLGARGRIEEKAPLTWGEAYFSEYSFANLLALNPVFTFVRDAFYDAGTKEQVAATMQTIYRPDAAKVTRQMLGRSVDDSLLNRRLSRQVRFDKENASPPNVILIIMESFGSRGIGCLRPSFPYDLTPRFDSLTQEGLLFTNIYSAGIHTYAGLMATLYGYPELPGGSVMKLFTSENSFWGLPSTLREHDYQTLFFCTHDPQFDNMQGFLMSNGMMRVYSLFDYASDEKLSTLGVPDHVMFDHAVEFIKKNHTGRRFFATLLTASNHGPWKIPDVPFQRVPATDGLADLLNAFKYSDWALGHFVRKIENDPAFAHTLIIVTGDNGILVRPIHDPDLSQYEIPILIYDTDHKIGSGQRINRLGSQVDILATVMGLLQLNYDDQSFGNDLLDTSTIGTGVNNFALMSEGYTVGYVENGYYLISRLGGKPSLYSLAADSLDLAEIVMEIE